MIKNFRDLLALLIGVIVFPGLWALQGFGIVNILTKPGGQVVLHFEL